MAIRGEPLSFLSMNRLTMKLSLEGVAAWATLVKGLDVWMGGEGYVSELGLE